MARRDSTTQMLSAVAALAAGSGVAFAAQDSAPDAPRPIIMTSLASASPAASNEARVDPNTADSPYAGVASLFIGGRHLATGAAISRRHILTAAHCFDLDNDGLNETGTDVAIFFNLDDAAPITIPAASVESVEFHPDYTGFLNPTLNDDLALITLSEPLPDRIPDYDLHRDPLQQGEIVRLVGYGETGDGESGYVRGSGFFTTKRLGANVADRFFEDDEGSAALELWQFDFDGPSGVGFLGDGTIGEGIEATLGFGDSGGPGFVRTREGVALASVNNFVSGPGEAGAYGSGGGGVLIHAYLDWLDSRLSPTRIGDIDGDGRVDQTDMRLLVSSWGTDDPDADLNRDGVVDKQDFTLLLEHWDR